jgi:hypothetical protein
MLAADIPMNAGVQKNHSLGAAQLKKRSGSKRFFRQKRMLCLARGGATTAEAPLLPDF